MEAGYEEIRLLQQARADPGGNAMTLMTVEQAEALLKKAGQFLRPPAEPTIFDAGGRGYYENPTSDLLAFFLDPAQAHGLQDCFLMALMESLADLDRLSPSLRSPPQREVATQGGPRIDLLLQGDGWVMVLENKIYHGQNNPFADYERHAREYASEVGDQILLVVLSPAGDAVPQGWQGLGYARFIEASRRRLAQRLMDAPLSKWQVFARDFLLHLENVTMEREMDVDAIRFVFENMSEISQLMNLKEKAISALERKILDRCSAEVPGYEPFKRRHTWYGCPALRFASNNWETMSDVVVYLDSSGAELEVSVRVYVCAVDKALTEKARAAFEDAQSNSWLEQNSAILAVSWSLGRFDEEAVCKLASEKMQKLMDFETRVRPGLQ